MKTRTFSDLSLSKPLLQNLEALGYDTMTPIQAESLPVMLEGRDLIAQAKTGSGKTAAFGLGMLIRLNTEKRQLQELVLCPTRELAEQIAGELRRLARTMPNVKIVTLYGGVPLGPQRASLQSGAHIAVGTPGRIEDHLGKGTLSLQQIHTLVLDEADRMLDMGFGDDIARIAAQTPPSRRTLLFSATFPETITAISRTLMKSPVIVTVDTEHEKDDITHRFYRTGSDRDTLLLQLLSHYRPESAVIFCNTKTDCDALADMLGNAGFSALALHADYDQRERAERLVQFANGSCTLLVATDVAARGLDIKSLQAVVNYELPHDPEVYIHRAGRTGRAGERGTVLSIVTPAEKRRAANIMEAMGSAVGTFEADTLQKETVTPVHPQYSTLAILGGKKNKLRPGDLLGALTGGAGIDNASVGKIEVMEKICYVAIRTERADQALRALQNVTIKGKKFRIRLLR